ncbi:MAG: hypothetical protein QY323_04505 [Patescibacteria group bacterium]|nr:MAG: hypothetical protein QY323_04505 [Patescibacteria group bacterium]
METVALCPLPRIKPVPTQNFPKDRCLERDAKLKERRMALSSAAVNSLLLLSAAPFTGMCWLLLVLLSMHVPWFPLWSLGCLLVVSIVLSFCTWAVGRAVVGDIRAFRESKVTPELAAAAAREERALNQGWALNGEIMAWNEMAAVAEANPGVDKRVIDSLRSKRVGLIHLRQGAIDYIRDPDKAP